MPNGNCRRSLTNWHVSLLPVRAVYPCHRAQNLHSFGILSKINTAIVGRLIASSSDNIFPWLNLNQVDKQCAIRVTLTRNNDLSLGPVCIYRQCLVSGIRLSRLLSIYHRRMADDPFLGALFNRQAGPPAEISFRARICYDRYQFLVPLCGTTPGKQAATNVP